jgi:hypothetical protein
MVCTIDTEFKHPNFGIKEKTVHLVFPLSFQYYYVAKIHTDFLLVKMKENINKEMVGKRKKRKSLKSELGGSQATSELEHDDKKRKKMVVTLSNRRKIIFSKMENFNTGLLKEM